MWLWRGCPEVVVCGAVHVGGEAALAVVGHGRRLRWGVHGVRRRAQTPGRFPSLPAQCQPRLLAFGPYALCYTQRMWTINICGEWVPFVHEYERVTAEGQHFYWTGEFLYTDGPMGNFVFDGDWVYLPKWTSGFGTPWCGFAPVEPIYMAIPHAYFWWGYTSPDMWTYPDTTVLQNTRKFPLWF